jgi:hypothetical protein
MLVFQGNHVNDEVAWPQPDENNQMEDWAKREYTFILSLSTLQPHPQIYLKNRSLHLQ